MALRAAIVELASASKWTSSSSALCRSISFLSSPPNSSVLSRLLPNDASHVDSLPVAGYTYPSTPFSTECSFTDHDSDLDPDYSMASVNFDGKRPEIDSASVALGQEMSVDAGSSKFSVSFVGKPPETDSDFVVADEDYRGPEIDVNSLPNEQEILIDAEKQEELLSLLQSSMDDSLRSNLENLNLVLHEELVLKVLETPCVLPESLLFFFDWALRKPSFSPTPRSVESLVKAVLNENKQKKIAYHLWDIVKEIAEEGRVSVTVATLNMIISCFASLGKARAALQVFNKFPALGCLPNSETYFYIVESLCRRSFFDQASEISKKMVENGVLPGGSEMGKMISLFCKGGRPEDARMIYLSAKEEKMILPPPPVNFLIKSLSLRYQMPHYALEMVEDLAGEARQRALRQFTWVIRGFCRINDVDSAKSLLGKMMEGGPTPGNTVFNNVINCLSKKGDVGEAERMMKVMEGRKMKPDVYTYTVIMSGYVSGGEMEEACRVMSMAKKKHKVLSPATYHTLISGFCRLGEFDRAVKMVEEMKESGVDPGADEYGKLIQSLCLKSLDWKMAEKLMEEMKGRGLQLNSNTRALVGAVKELMEEEDDDRTTDFCSET